MTYQNFLYSAFFAACIAGGNAVAQSIVIRDVTLLDGTGEAALSDAWVSIADNYILGIGTGNAPDAPLVIDGHGHFLIPGLIDAHVHIGGGRIRTEGDAASEMEARRAAAIPALHGYLYSGVTTVYDSGNFSDFIFPLREEERAGRILSPRIYATGGVVAFPGGYGAGPGATVIGSEADFGQLDTHLDYKPDMVKILLDPQGRRGIPEAPVFPSRLLTKVIERIHDRDIRTTVHIPSEAEAREAIAAGIDALAHLPARTELSDDFIALASAQRVPMATTLAVFSNIARVADDPGMFDTPLYQAVLPRGERTRQQTVERDRYISSGMSDFFARMLPGMQQRLLALYEGGAVLALGTDRSFGPTVHQELSLIVQSGIPPAQVLRMATLNAAIYLGIEDHLGSIQPGKLADMVLLSADLTVDITNAEKIVLVIKNGEVIDRTGLDVPANE